MVSRDELIAIVGGSLAGLVLLLVIVAICVYCCCGRKKEQKKNIRRFQPLSHGNDSSKPSTLNGVDPRANPRSNETRLPKVGNSGLWMATPSMYAAPHPYYKDRHGPHGNRSSSLQRASSEERLHQSRGHQVYNGGRNLQMYHSSSPYYYEPYGLPRTNSYLDMYGGYPQYNTGSSRDSRAMLVEYPDGQEYIYNPYRDAADERHHGKKVKRTHSDLTGTKRKKRERRRESPSFEGRKSKNSDKSNKNYDRSASVESHKIQPRDPSFVQTSLQRKPTEFSEQTATIDIHDNELSECATDSAKIRAIQGRNNEPEPISKKWEGKEDLRLDLPSDINDDIDDLHVKRYQYDGKNKPTDNAVYRPSDNATKNGYTNSAFIENEKRDSHIHKRLEKRESNTDGKQVSAAFDFLDSYMSDDDEAFPRSRQQSPLPFDT